MSAGAASHRATSESAEPVRTPTYQVPAQRVPAGEVAGQLTGAEALAAMLHTAGVSVVFTYPGTSELALCDAICAAGMTLVNSRGDKEAAFMAAGASLAEPGSAAALLHGARGLTNALGAVADARRTEAAALFVVGMASRASADFLPPHAETDLIAAAGRFARAAFDCSSMVDLDAAGFVRTCRAALRAVHDRPGGPVLLGIPQDVLGTAFVAADEIGEPTAQDAETPPAGVEEALTLLHRSRNPVIVVDDYYLRSPTAEHTLAAFADALPAAVLQVAYRRGPMLFQHVRAEHVARYAGILDPGDTTQQKLLADADLLVTVEDRNMYPRVVGRLPDCPKLAVTSHPAATAKNGYLGPRDVLLTGPVEQLLDRLVSGLADGPERTENVAHLAATPRTGSDAGRRLVEALGQGLASVERLSIVDDSQMFGGLVALHYDRLPAHARVFGSHGGFVGSGLATAVGASHARPAASVVCFVGDQGFANGVQALAVAGQVATPLLIIVCNNGSSVSLRRQALSDGLAAHGNHLLMGNTPTMSYTGVARGYGLTAERITWPAEPTEQDAIRLRHAVAGALRTPRAHLLELVTPGDAEFWQDVWVVAGFEAPATNDNPIDRA